MEKQEPSRTGQSTGKVFVMLVTYQINECQQCQEEHSERHQVFKIEIIVHKHHLHSVRMKVNHPVSRLPVALLLLKILYHKSKQNTSSIA